MSDSGRYQTSWCSAGIVCPWGSRFHHVMTATTPTNEIALAMNTAPGPAAAMRMPATAGPIDWAMLEEIELSATACESVSIGTSSGVSDVNAGMLTVPPTDNRNVSTSSHVVVT